MPAVAVPAPRSTAWAITTTWYRLFPASSQSAWPLQVESIASAGRTRRQRNLDQIEISEDSVTISGDLLGKGGFGSVYIADYGGINAAAKVSAPLNWAQHKTKTGSTASLAYSTATLSQETMTGGKWVSAAFASKGAGRVIA